MRRASATVVLAMVWTAGVAAGPQQPPGPLHDSQYSDADITYGAALYTSKCVTCHGAQGDGIGGVNLRSGTFRNARIDRDLERFIRAGSPAGMPPFALDNAEMAGIIAYLRNMNAFDNAAVTAPARSTQQLWPEQRPGAPLLTIAGSIPAGARPATLAVSAQGSRL